MIKPTKININNEASCCLIEIEGTIGVPEEWQFDDPDSRVATYERFRESVARIAQIEAPEIIVSIRSTGGDVNDALLIHDALRQLNGRITTRCYGYTASAATIIAQAASEGCREISANALYLIHQATCTTEGNASQLSEQLDLLRTTDERLGALYAARSGRPQEEFQALMSENNGNGRWLSPDEVIAAGLADRIIGSETSAETSPAQPASTEQPSALRNGIHRLLRAIGVESATAQAELPEDHNILHFQEVFNTQRRRAISSMSAQKQYEPTRTKSVEDPSYQEATLSANAKAYAEDLKQIKRY
ncbi:MAG: Clp protease ClpP [Alistipes sp.]|nr:Clp protease ClpP [Alistipes sp.]